MFLNGMYEQIKNVAMVMQQKSSAHEPLAKHVVEVTATPECDTLQGLLSHCSGCRMIYSKYQRSKQQLDKTDVIVHQTS